MKSIRLFGGAATLVIGMGPSHFRVDRSTGFNDLEVADDGTIYATQTGDR